MPETVFKKTDYTLAHLLYDIDHGDIGLPELQRSFVWKPVKVRDLFDSMYRGFPVGYLLFWSNASVQNAKQIGTQDKQSRVPYRLVVDGQQRLTALYSVVRGREVLNHKFEKKRISIAFHPPTEQFEVTTAAHRKNVEWIADISRVWEKGKGSFTIINEYLERLSQRRSLSPSEREQLAKAIDRLYDLENYPFTALEISHKVDEEQVADIFVRINSKGVRLQQSDFILTLMSVFWEEGRRKLESFCRRATEPSRTNNPSPYTPLFAPEPDALLRVLIGLGLKRAVLRRVYNVLRGKDIETGNFSAEIREEQFRVLQNALPAVIDLTNWHEFIKCILTAGYRRPEMILSSNAVIFAYTLFLIGRVEHNIPLNQVRRLISRWFYAAAVTARLTGSFETDMEGFLRRLSTKAMANEYIETIEHDISLMLTNDFWNLVLPEYLATAASRSPALYAFQAAQYVLNAPVLFSKLSVQDLSDPLTKPKKKALERHHLFPKAYLRKLGITDNKEIDQIANQTFVEWPVNIQIGAQPPIEYVPEIRSRLSLDDEEWASMMKLHALPENWHEMEYFEFLRTRRKLMADLVRQAFESL